MLIQERLAMKGKKRKKCKTCGEMFIQILKGVNYCSGECEKRSHNPVAKFDFNRGGVHKSKRTYSRKEKHREQL